MIFRRIYGVKGVKPMEDMEKIYQEHARTVFKFLMSQCHEESLAEELTQ